MWSTDGVEWSLQQLKAVIAGWTDWQWILPQISAKALDPRTFPVQNALNYHQLIVLFGLMDSKALCHIVLIGVVNITF